MGVKAKLFFEPKPTNIVWRSPPVSGCVLGSETPIILSSKCAPLGAPLPVWAIDAIGAPRVTAAPTRASHCFFIFPPCLLLASTVPQFAVAGIRNSRSIQTLTTPGGLGKQSVGRGTRKYYCTES